MRLRQLCVAIGVAIGRFYDFADGVEVYDLANGIEQRLELDLPAQRWHVAYHYRQLIDFLSESDVVVADPFPLDRLDGLDLPAELY